MSNNFTTFIQRRKKFLVLVFVMAFFSSLVLKLFKLEESYLNIFLIIVLPLIVFSLVYIFTEQKNRKE
ncbi:MAG: hypothetical protein WDO16_21800 [Bacteroidota bacterium]